jgi:hypothetical protein
MENRKEFMQTADDRLMATDVSLEPNQTMIDKGESAPRAAAANHLPGIARRAALIGDSSIAGIWPLAAKPDA